MRTAEAGESARASSESREVDGIGTVDWSLAELHLRDGICI